ncbi:hypothetical protein PSPO01_00616 [Paraphaeosphaeria sporulosa]
MDWPGIDHSTTSTHGTLTQQAFQSRRSANNYIQCLKHPRRHPRKVAQPVTIGVSTAIR